MKAYFILIVLCVMVPFSWAQSSELRFQSGHSQVIHQIQISPDQRFFVTGSSDRSVIIWDMKTFRALHYLRGHQDEVVSVAISPDSKQVASVGFDNVIKVWDALTGKELFTLEDKFWRAPHIQFSPDGKKLAFTSLAYKNEDPKMGWFDLNSKTLEFALTTQVKEVERVFFSPDGRFLYGLVKRGELVKVDTYTKSIVYQKNVSTKPPEEYASIKTGAISPDGTLLAVGWSFDRQNIEIFDTQTGNRRITLRGHSSDILSLTFNPEGTQVVSTNWANSSVPGHIKFWEITSGTEVKTIKGMRQDFIRSIAFARDGRLFTAQAADVTTWNTQTLKVHQSTISLRNNIQNVFVENASNEVFIERYSYEHSFGFGYPMFELQSLKVGQQRFFTEVINEGKGVSSAIPLHTKPLIITVDNKTARTIQVRNAKTLDVQRTWTPYPNNNITLMFVSPNEEWVFTMYNDSKGIDVWELSTGRLIKKELGQPPTKYGPSFAALSKDSKHVYLSYFSQVQCFDTATWTLQFSFKPAYSITEMRLNARESLLVMAERDGWVEVYDKGQQKVVFRQRANKSNLHSAMFSQDDKHIITAGSDGVIRVWDYRTAKVLHELSKHNNSVNRIAYTPDGRFILSSSMDGSVGIWHVHDYSFAAQVFFKDEKEWAVVTADGKFDGTPNALQLVHYVKGTEVIPLEAFFEQNYMPNVLTDILSGKRLTQGLSAQTREVTLPPKVRMLQPTHGQTIQGNQSITVQVEVTDMGGGIDEVRLFHNGRLVSDQTRGIRPKAETGQKLTRTYSLSMISGANQIRAIAINNQRTESQPAEVTVQWSAPVAGSSLHVLAIGIDEYKNPRYNLNYGKADARAYATAIKELSGSIFRAIQVKELYDKDASRTAILGALRDIQQKARPEDVFMLYYAGHGVMSEGEAQVPSDFYMALHSITQLYGNDQQLVEHGISATELRSIVAQIPALKQVIVLDACQSGGAVQTFAMRGAAEEKALMNLARSTGVVVFASTGSEQFATEFGQLGHGVFTYALLEGLRGAADTSPKDGQLTVQELNVFLNYRVPELTEKYRGTTQYPNTWVRGMDFPLGVIKK